MVLSACSDGTPPKKCPQCCGTVAVVWGSPRNRGLTSLRCTCKPVQKIPIGILHGMPLVSSVGLRAAHAEPGTAQGAAVGLSKLGPAVDTRAQASGAPGPTVFRSCCPAGLVLCRLRGKGDLWSGLKGPALEAVLVSARWGRYSVPWWPPGVSRTREALQCW